MPPHRKPPSVRSLRHVVVRTGMLEGLDVPITDEALDRAIEETKAVMSIYEALRNTAPDKRRRVLAAAAVLYAPDDEDPNA